jgi:hypothetical protein
MQDARTTHANFLRPWLKAKTAPRRRRCAIRVATPEIYDRGTAGGIYLAPPPV